MKTGQQEKLATGVLLQETGTRRQYDFEGIYDWLSLAHHPTDFALVLD